jgi:hypothetical protein
MIMKIKQAQHIFNIRGYTALELLLAIAVITLMGVAAISYMRGGIVTVSGDGATRDLLAAIRSARGSALAGNFGAAWGVRTIHGGVSGADRFEVFATSSPLTPNIADVGTLPEPEVHLLLPGVSWGEAGDRAVIFYPAATSVVPVTFQLKYGGGMVQIVVASSGMVSVQ